MASFTTVKKLCKHDVVCGRNKLAYEYTGNKYFRKLIAENSDAYKSTKMRSEKHKIAMKIISHIESIGGRFFNVVKSNNEQPENSTLVEVSQSYKYEKVTHALRHVRLKPKHATKSGPTKVSTVVLNDENNIVSEEITVEANDTVNVMDDVLEGSDDNPANNNIFINSEISEADETIALFEAEQDPQIFADITFGEVYFRGNLVANFSSNENSFFHSYLPSIHMFGSNNNKPHSISSNTITSDLFINNGLSMLYASGRNPQYAGFSYAGLQYQQITEIYRNHAMYRPYNQGIDAALCKEYFQSEIIDDVSISTETDTIVSNVSPDLFLNMPDFTD